MSSEQEKGLWQGVKDSESLLHVRLKLLISPDTGLLQQHKALTQGMFAALMDTKDMSRLLSLMI